MGNKEKSEAMLTGKYYLKCEHTPCKCIDLESCDNSVLMEKRLPQPIESEDELWLKVDFIINNSGKWDNALRKLKDLYIIIKRK